MSKINNESSDKENLNLKNLRSFKKIDYLSDYWSQVGLNIDKNISIKIKPFFYGRRINEFKELPSKSFACYSEILGILADWKYSTLLFEAMMIRVVGNVKNLKLKDVLNNNQFIKNLRSYEGNKHEVCKKCFGEPTKRGVVFRTIFNQFKRFYR